jgi:hypothetical protein
MTNVKKPIKPLNHVALMHPVHEVSKIGTSYFDWPQLIVRPSLAAGNGLFAAEDLPAGTAIPIIGKPLSDKQFYDVQNTVASAHVWKHMHLKVFLDGNPKHHPYKNVGSGGLAIAMIANEPNRKKPTCIFKRDCLITARHVRAGEELTVFYDHEYEIIRTLKGYSLERNMYFNEGSREIYFPQLARVKYPSDFSKQRGQLLSSLLGKSFR